MENPNGFLERIDTIPTEKEHLSKDELIRLANTPCEYPILKTAFLFACLTGLRKIDIKQLTWKNIQPYGDGGMYVTLRMQKTKELVNNDIESTKSFYDYDLVVSDSMGTEKNFAESLEHEDDVVVYTKLPNGFYINTPMGKYNPDWAVAFREGSVKHVYFVAESKGNDLQGSQLRGSEESKIECARRHFKAISDNCYIYDVAKDYKSLYDIVTK